MAYPSIDSVGQNSTAAGTSHAITLPSGIQIGDLLILIFATDGDNTITNWDTFTGIDSESNGSASFGAIGYRYATGSDACTIETSVSEPGSHVVYRISGHDSGQIPEASTVAEGASLFPDPDTLSPTGGAKDYLWIHACTWDRNRTVSAWNANFTLSRTYESGGASGSASVGVSGMNDNTATKDPTSITISTSDQWVAWTIAVHPVSATTAYKDIGFKTSLLSADTYKDIGYKTSLVSPTTYKDIGFKTSFVAVNIHDIGFKTSLTAITDYKDIGFKTSLTGWFNVAWGYRKRIIIDSTKVAADLTDFPALVYRATDSDLAEHCRADFYDVVFTEDDGVTQLKHEIDEFSDSTGKLLAWVKIPSLSSSKDTEIYMYYGNPAATDQQDKDNTWKTEYKAVWHLGEDDFTDSSGNSHTVTNDGTVDTTGKIGGARDFTYTDPDKLDKADHSDFTFGNGTTDSPFSVSAWIDIDNDSALQGIVTKYNTGGLREWYLLVHSLDRLYFVLFSQGGSASYLYVQGGTVLTTGGGPYHVVATYDGSGDYTNLELYVNGSLDTPYNFNAEVGTYVAMDDYSALPSIGISGTGGSPFDGMIDESRVMAEELTANWISTEFQNQNDPAAFLTAVDSEQTILGFKDIVFKTSLVAGDYKDVGFKTSLEAGETLVYKDIGFITSLLSADTYKDIGYKTSLKSPDQFKDIGFQTSLISSDQFHDIGFKTSLTAITAYKDIGFKTSLLSADTFKDIGFITSLLSADTYKDIGYKTSLVALTIHDIGFKTSLEAGETLAYKDIGFITSLLSADTYKDIGYKTSLVSPTTYKDIGFTTSLLSADTYKDIGFKTSIKSLDTYKDIGYKTSLLSADTYKDVGYKTSLIGFSIYDIAFITSLTAFVAPTNYKDIGFKTSLLSADTFKDIGFKTSLTSLDIYKDIGFTTSLVSPITYADIGFKTSLVYSDIVDLHKITITISKHNEITMIVEKSSNIKMELEKNNEINMIIEKEGIER